MAKIMPQDCADRRRKMGISGIPNNVLWNSRPGCLS